MQTKNERIQQLQLLISNRDSPSNILIIFHHYKIFALKPSQTHLTTHKPLGHIWNCPLSTGCTHLTEYQSEIQHLKFLPLIKFKKMSECQTKAGNQEFQSLNVIGKLGKLALSLIQSLIHSLLT